MDLRYPVEHWQDDYAPWTCSRCRQPIAAPDEPVRVPADATTEYRYHQACALEADLDAPVAPNAEETVRQAVERLKHRYRLPRRTST